MKKILFVLTALMLLITGCDKEKFGSEGKADGEKVKATFTANVRPTSKAFADGNGNGANVNRCIMEIYYEGVLYQRIVTGVSSDKKAYFDFELVANRTYDVLFWADCSGEGLSNKYYNADDLRAVKMTGTEYEANDDCRDAFFWNEESITVGQQVESRSFTLYRPFAQVNVITTDASVIKTEKLYPDKVEMVYTAPTQFNLLSKELSEEKEITVSGGTFQDFSDGQPLYLAMDYLFASDQKGAIDIEFEATKTGNTPVNHSFTSIPIQRNHRTNIKGALLTTTRNWNAKISPDWDQPDEEYNYASVGSVAAANEAFAEGITSVEITSVGDEKTLYLPLTEEDVFINFANPSETVTIKYGPAPATAGTSSTKAANPQPASLNITTNDVAKFTVTGISNVVWLAGNQAALASALNNAVAGQTVALANDITMSENWISVSRGSNTPNFDGRNHAISNMTITTEEDAYVGLFSTIKNHVTLQNVTFKNAKLLIPESVGEHARGGVLVGHMYPSDVINCHVEGATIVGCQKLGGLIGYIEGDAANATVTVKDCSVKDVNISSNRSGNYLEHGVGGFIGHLSLSQAHLITIENNSVENITIAGNKPMENYSTSVFIQLVPHAFIGNACQTCACSAAAVGDHKIILNNNRILGDNTVLPTCIYSSDYFGWAGNAEERPAWKGVILIDGQEWTPNYPFQIAETGVKYPELAEAINAAEAGQTVKIITAGEYTIPGISKNITIAGDVDGVVFNCNGSGSIASIPNGATFRNVTMNFGQSSYHGFQHAGHIVMDECTLNGLFFSYGDMTFNSCVFNQDNEEYSMWDYGKDLTYNDCEFHGKGKFINVYCESNATTYKLIANNCKFYSDKVNKSAFNIKETCGSTLLKYDVEINGCETNENFPTNKIGGSKVWMVDDQSSTGESFITVKVDGEKVYPLTTFHVSTAEALRKAVKCVNAGKEATEYTIILADGTYEVSDIAIAENANGKKVIIKSANPKGATLKMNSGSKTREIFLIDGCSNIYSTSSVTFEGLKFEILAGTNSDNCAAPVYAFKQDDPLATTIGYTAAHAQGLRYAHDITISNCELKGAGVGTNSMMFYAKNNTSAKDITVTGCTIQAVDYLYSGYASNFTASNCVCNDEIKAFVNHQVEDTNTLTISGCTIKAKYDYIIRTSSGPVSIVNNTFYASWTGDESDNAGAIVLRKNTSTAEISGNTFNKADNDMADVYCNAACTVNNEAKEAGSKINF